MLKVQTLDVMNTQNAYAKRSNNVLGRCQHNEPVVYAKLIATAEFIIRRMIMNAQLKWENRQRNGFCGSSMYFIQLLTILRLSRAMN